MLFVNHDEGEVCDRRKYSRTSSHHHAGFATANAMPLFGTLLVGKGGVEDGDFITEDLVKVGGHSRSKADFGDEQDGGTARFQNRAHGREIHGSFSRASHTMQQNATELSRGNAFLNFGERFLLRVVQLKLEWFSWRRHCSSDGQMGAGCSPRSPKRA